MAINPNIQYFSFITYAQPAQIGGTVGFNSYSNFRFDWFWLSYTTPSISDFLSYYSNLLILQYRTKPRAVETIEVSVEPFIQNILPIQIRDGFDLDTAVGVQLDILGKYIGASRSGFGFTSSITLSDSDYRILLQIAIVKNASRSSLASIQSLLNQFFAGDIYIFDYQNMNISYLVNTSLGTSDLFQLFITENFLPRPMGVGMSVIGNAVIDQFFGLRTYDAVASPQTVPLNTYDSFNTSWLVMSYIYSINI